MSPLSNMSRITRNIDKKVKEAKQKERDRVAAANGDTFGVGMSKEGFETSQFMKEGRRRGEELVGVDSATVGKERADVRQKYKDILEGKSIVKKEMKQDLATRQKQARAQSAVSGQSQLAPAQQQAMGRQAASDMASARSKEYLGVLNKIEKQFRGAAGDISRLEGQYGSIGVGGQAPASGGGGGGMSVVCTELHRQGFMSDYIKAKDEEYGAMMRRERMEVFVGYLFLAQPVVKLMKKSKVFTKLISIPALKWANNMAGNKNFTGAMISKYGEKFCGIVGNILMKYNMKEVF